MSPSGETIVSVASSPIQFKLDAIDTFVEEDTITPANNKPLPVKLMGLTGPVTLNSDQININLDDTDDSVALGDGAGTIIGVSGSPIISSDPAVEAELITLNTVNFATETTLASILADTTSIAAEDFATETTLASILADTASIAAEDFATETTLAALAAEDFATETTLAALAAEDFATETTLLAMSAKLPVSLGEKVEADSLSVTLSTENEQTLFNIEADINDISSATGDQSDSAEPNPANNGSIISLLKGVLTLITSTNTKLDTIEADVSPNFSSHNTAAVTSISAVTFTAPAGAKRMIIQNSLAAGGAIRFTPVAATPTASDGFYLGVGQSTSEMAAGSFKAISLAASEDGDVSVIWSV